MAYSKTTWKNRVVQNPQTYLQQQNTDGTVTLIPKEGTITEPGTPVNAVNMNNIEDGISTLDAQNSIYNAGGTANAITVATTNGDYSYAQFKRLSIKAASDNTGNVTINVDGKGAVPALKYDKSQLPAGAIKAGKVYDFYYDTANACFFLIAKASGNAVAADVLAGKTFSNDSDSGLIGTGEGKQDILSYMNNGASISNTILGFVNGEGLWKQNGYNATCFDKNGNAIKTITTPITNIKASHVSKNNALFYTDTDYYLTDKNGTLLKNNSFYTDTTSLALYHENLQWFIQVGENTLIIKDVNGTQINGFSKNSTANTGYAVYIVYVILTVNGLLFSYTQQTDYVNVCFMDSTGAVTRYSQFGRTCGGSVFMVNGI